MEKKQDSYSWLKKAREMRGWTIQDAAERAKLSSGTIMSIENRERPASKKTQFKLMKLYGSSHDFLFDNNGYARKTSKPLEFMRAIWKRQNPRLINMRKH